MRATCRFHRASIEDGLLNVYVTIIAPMREIGCTADGAIIERLHLTSPPVRVTVPLDADGGSPMLAMHKLIRAYMQDTEDEVPLGTTPIS